MKIEFDQKVDNKATHKVPGFFASKDDPKLVLFSTELDKGYLYGIIINSISGACIGQKACWNIPNCIQIKGKVTFSDLED